MSLPTPGDRRSFSVRDVAVDRVLQRPAGNDVGRQLAVRSMELRRGVHERLEPVALLERDDDDKSLATFRPQARDGLEVVILQAAVLQRSRYRADGRASDDRSDADRSEDPGEHHPGEPADAGTARRARVDGLVRTDLHLAAGGLLDHGPVRNDDL